MKEAIHINIKKTEVEKLGLRVGPWLNDFKNALFEQKPNDMPLEIVTDVERNRKKVFRLQDLVEKIAIITPGQKIAYITDVQYKDENLEKIIPFVNGSDHLFIEAAFSEKHKDIAHAKKHLTARQAGEIAGKARVGRFTIFHFSPRYTDNEKMLKLEAETAYKEALTA
jgi:ribonuclease Z